MSKPTVAALVLGAAVLCISSWAMADAAADYQELYGKAEKEALAKGGMGAPQFAAKLLTAAKKVEAQKDLQAMLCQKACELGMKTPAGFFTAIDAMKLLVELAAEAEKADAEKKLLTILQSRFANSKGDDHKRLGEEFLNLLVDLGDERVEAKEFKEAKALYDKAKPIARALKPERAKEISDKLAYLAAAVESENRIAKLRADLAKNPGNVAARTELVVACLGELDDPAEAVKVAKEGVVDDVVGTNVSFAATKVVKLEEGKCLELAEWYLALADKAPPAGKGVILSRALACCERYLVLHTAGDKEALKCGTLLDKVITSIQKAGPGLARAPTLTLNLGIGAKMKLVLIPAGTFTMGSPEKEPGREGQESPQHPVTITNPFYMGVCKVTQAQHKAVMGRNPSKFDGSENPVDSVSWADAMGFCGKLSRNTGKTVRLPTEAEWEYACRAGTMGAYPFGDDAGKLGDYAWFGGNASGQTHPVRKKKPNPWGLYDMQGNLWELCSDWLSGSYANAKPVDPTGPPAGFFRVRRGGSWSNYPNCCRSAFRSYCDPKVGDSITGLRAVVEAAGKD
jgi:formylglycine-generating enzyme required for sulfatase activity